MIPLIQINTFFIIFFVFQKLACFLIINRRIIGVNNVNSKQYNDDRFVFRCDNSCSATFYINKIMNIKKIFTEIFRLTICIFGVLTLYLSLVSIINAHYTLFSYLLPFNVAFIVWYHFRLNKLSLKFFKY